jgi:predicted Zn-dependent protease with MMP-like domain
VPSPVTTAVARTGEPARQACDDGPMRPARQRRSSPGQRPERRASGDAGHLRRVGLAALVALSLGLVLIVLAEGFSSIGALRALEDVALGLIAAALLMGVSAFVAVRLAGWRDPESETEFDALIRHSESLAREGLAVDPDEAEFLELDPLDDEDFEELVRDALDDLPDLLRNALRHVAVVVSDGGRRAHAYGLYEGDGAARDDHADRIVIYRDTLRRDFGHDPQRLRDQVTRTVRHELAHHVGFDELGVSRLDL